MLTCYSNMTLDEMLKEISYENYDFFIELQSRIESRIESEKLKIEEKQTVKEDLERNYILDSLETMEYLCSDVEWIKQATKSEIRYYVKGFDGSCHYENHNISICCNKNSRTSWNVQINCGELGETGKIYNVNGNFKEAQQLAVTKAKEFLKRGDYLLMI